MCARANAIVGVNPLRRSITQPSKHAFRPSIAMALQLTTLVPDTCSRAVSVSVNRVHTSSTHTTHPGDDVAQLQNYLREESLMRGDDAYPGYFGEVTEAAVVKWQQRHDLPATGAFGDLARETYIQKQVCI